MFYFIIDILGTIAFAVSGVLVAMEKRLDLFGVFIIAFVTSVGGGTLRDVLIGSTPVGWMQSGTYIYVILGAVIVSILLADHLRYLSKPLFLFDTIGVGLFTMVGVQKAEVIGLMPIMCVAIGTITACFGGVLRDILCAQIPVLFRKEIYATACIVGASGYFLIKQLPIDIGYAYVGGIIITTVVRFAAVRFNIGLPNIYSAES